MILTLTAAATFACAPIKVYDGDTLTCSSEVRVRLAAVDAPEMGKCRRGRVCAPGDPVASRNALSRLALGKTLQCRKTGMSYNRVVAWCKAGSIDPALCSKCTKAITEAVAAGGERIAGGDTACAAPNRSEGA